MTDEEAVLDLEAKRIRAMTEGDADLMLSILQDDHVHVTATGLVTDKQGASEPLRGIPRKVEPGPTKVRLYGDIAILTGFQTGYVTINDQPAAMQLFITRVARRSDGVWRFVSMQGTGIPT